MSSTWSAAMEVPPADWPALLGALERLAEEPPAGPDPSRWLAEWSRLSDEASEAANIVSIRYTQDTEDADRKAAYLAYLREVSPRLRIVEQRLKDHLLDSGWEPPELATVLRQFRADATLFRAENVPLLAEERAEAAKYDEIVGGLAVEFEGELRTIAQLAPYRASPDRSVREGAWRAGMDVMLGVRTELDELFDRLLALRVRIAANAGCANYLEYRWPQMGRFDYSPADSVALQEAVLAECVPALERLAKRRRATLDVEPLRPWDLEVDLFGGAPLAPFRTGQELAEGSHRIFQQLDPALGDMVGIMEKEGLLDLENRPGKAPGGYCSSLPARGRPFIFMNAVGTEDNVRTMLHEAGHAFHVFDRNGLALTWQRRSPMEFNEVASMSMELLTSPYLEQESGGFYSQRDAVRARLQHLERILHFLPYMATVDAFQHWLYTHPEHSRDERDATWLALHRRYNVGTSWEGFDESRESLWQQKLHIFQAPFYYIEYGIAQLGALQVWRNSLADPAGALASYRQALALGGTVPLPELFRAAGARLVFDVAGVRDLVALVEGAMANQEALLAGLSD